MFLQISRYFFFFLICGALQTLAFECYTCNMEGSDKSCLLDPANVPVGSPITDCTRGWCTIMRQEAKELPGIVRSFRRACERTEPMFIDEIIEDDHFKSFYRSCRTQLCNEGDGTVSLIHGGDGGQGEYGDMILVRSENSSANIYLKFFMLFPALIIAFLYY